MRKATDKEINDFIKYRSNHVALVQRIGRVVFDENFSDHDHDKIEADGETLNLYALRNAMINGTYQAHGEDRKALSKLAGEHVCSQPHHPEYWCTEITPNNFDDSNPPQCRPSRMTDRRILEMISDWSAVALKRNQPLFKWYNDNCVGPDARFLFTDHQRKIIEEGIQKIIDSIEKEHLEYPGVKYTAKQVEPKTEKKLEESEEQIYTDKFKSWFGDWENDPDNSSKVVDGEGKPLVVYHGTSRYGEFDSFKSNTYFSSNPDMASWYTSTDEEWADNQWYRNENRTYACYLNLRNPLIVDAEDNIWDSIEFEGEETTTDNLIKIARERGYDGLIVKNVIEASSDFGDDYVIFSPNQAKSATDNNGEFSSKSDKFNEDDCGGVCGVGMSAGFQSQAPEKRAKLGDGTGLIDPSGNLPLKENITLDELEKENLTWDQYNEIKSDNFKKWFGDWEKGEGSKVVGYHGYPKVVYHGTQNDFNEFDDSDLIFFTDDRLTARLFSEGDTSRPDGDILECFLNIRNPYVFDADWNDYDEVPFEGEEKGIDEILSILKKRGKFEGHDGIIVKNIKEGFMANYGTDYIPFKKDQIKSATGNNGNYSTESSNIYESKIKESILDVPMKDLYEGVIKDDKMTPECRGQIIETIKLWKKQINFDFNIYNIWAKGSLLTKRYNDTTDLDVSIYTDMTTEQLSQVMSIIPKGQNIIVNGKESTHPLDFYVLVKGDTADLANFDSVYDVAHDKWIKKSDDYENEIPLNYLMDVSNFFINGCSIAIQNYENDKVLYEYYNSLDPSSQEISEDEKEEHLARKKEDLKADLDALRVALRMISSFRTEAYTDGGMSLQIDIKSDNPHVTIQEQLAKILEKFGIRQKLRQYVDECSKILGVKKEIEDDAADGIQINEAMDFMASIKPRLREDNITGNVLKHMIHSEDLILEGRGGSMLLLRTFRDIFNALKGNTPTSRITQKIDGAPAVIAATDFHGKKFVALKHSWDKGKIFQSIEEVRGAFGDRPDLCAKMEYLFNSLDAINIPKDEIWHGDFLYHKDDLRTEVIEGKRYIIFRPNTIVYAIPVNDPLAETILKSVIGVAWHTKYTGESFDDIHISFDVSVSSVNEIPEVYQMDARIPSLVGRVTMTSEETDKAESNMGALELMVNGITADDDYEGLVSDEGLVLMLNTYRNFIIKDSNNQFPDIEGFKAWVSDRYEKEKDKKKTDKGKASVESRKQSVLSTIDRYSELIKRIYEAQRYATELKEIFVGKLNSLSGMRSFVSHISQGYISTSGEGFAVSDVDGNVYKLVSRLEFSRNNFSKEIIKGWQSEKRMNERILPKKSALKLFKEELESEDIQEENKSIEDAEVENTDIENNIDTFNNSINGNLPTDKKKDKKLSKEDKEIYLQDAKELFDTEINKNIKAEYKPLSVNNGQGIKRTPKNPVSDYMVHIAPEEKEYRTELQSRLFKFGDENPDIKLEKTPKDGTTPTARVTLNDEEDNEIVFDIRFKNNGKVGMTAEQTKNMEEIWAECVCREFENKYKYTSESEKVSFDDLIDEDYLESKGLNMDWAESIKQGTYTIVNRFSHNGENVYFVFREDRVFLPKSQQRDGIESLHKKIDAIVRDNRVFPKGTKKDTWNPSDIYICEVNSYDNFVKDWNIMTGNFGKNPEDMESNRDCVNELLRRYIVDDNNVVDEVVGISLKKITDDSRPRLENVNVDKNWHENEMSIDGSIKMPKLCLASERGNTNNLGGVRFVVINSKAEDEFQSRIKYDFRRFTKSRGLSLELEYENAKARIGKTPKILIGKEDESNNDESYEEEIYDDAEYEETQDTLADESFTNLIPDLIKLHGKVEALCNSSLKIYAGDKELSVADWDAFVNRVRSMGLNKITDPNDKEKLLDWPKIITFLYVLSKDVAGNLDKWYNGALKSGKTFAPYVKIS